MRHPTDPKSKEPVVMTTDFVVTCLQNGEQEEVARTLKYCKDLDAKRTVENLKSNAATGRLVESIGAL